MNKNQKMVIMVGFIFCMCGAMLVLSVNYTKDKPLIDAQNQQSVISNVNLSPDQMVNGLKQFANVTETNLSGKMP